MYYITYNPYWHAPDHLVRKTIAPNVLHLGMSYLKSHGYHVIDDWSETPNVIDPDDDRLEGCGGWNGASQDPAGSGPAEFDGNSEIPIPQSAGHLSPRHARPCEVRAWRKRNLSNGCVRVEDAKRLGRWLLGQDPVSPGTTPETSRSAAERRRRSI